MAKVVEVQLVAKTDDAVAGVNKVEKAVEKTARSAKKTSKELSGLQQAGNEVVKGLDRVTGGLASKFVAVGKAAKLSGKAMRTALISSGIGLAVAAVGLLVEYWDEIGEALGFINKDLERQVELNNQNLDAVGVRLRNIQTLIELRKREGKDVDLLLKKEKELTEQKKQAFITSIQDQALLVNRLKLKQQEGKLNEEDTKELQKQEGVYLDLMNSFNKFKSDLLEPVKEVVKKDTSTADAEAAEKSRIEAIERIRKGLIDTEAEERAEKLRLINEDYTEQIELAAKFYGTNSIKILELKAAQKKAEDEQKAIFAEQDKEKQDKIDQEAIDKEKKRLEDIQKIVNDATDLSELEKIERDRLAAQTELDLLGATWIEKARIAAYYQGLINDETTKQNKEANEKQKEDDEKLQDAKFRVASQTIDAISSIGKLFAGENEKNAKIAFKISKAVGIAQVGINTSQAIMKAAAETTDVTTTQSFRTANMIAIGVAGAAQIASIAAQKFEGGSDTVPKPSLGGGSQAPAFNVVGASGETQLADAIGSQTQRPSRAYVVSNDVTTAQEMDRNIIEGASIG
jgi:hypothetical protein